MKKIVFRGKSIGSNEWVFGGVVQFPNGHKQPHRVSIIPDNIGNYVPCIDVNPDTVGQYTGLKDINGIKIFEGDIIKQIESEYDYELLVKYDITCCQFGLFNPNRPESWMNDFEYKTSYEVIGNIYDDKGLMSCDN